MLQQKSAKNYLENAKQLVVTDFTSVNSLILSSLNSKVDLIRQIGHYIVDSGGKRLRPLLTLLVAKAGNYQGQQHIQLAAIIEFIHTATLLHDDVVDESNLRRGRKTANAIWGNQASILVGDFLYSRAFQMLNKLNNLRVMQIMADTTNVIAEGEVLQLLNSHNPDITEEQYMDVIRYKTAVLFAAAAQLGAVIANCNEEQQNAIADYGLHLGIAFQLIDDVLDYTASAETMGKNVGDDLAEGKVTLPLIYALKYANKSQAEIIRQAITNGGLENLTVIVQIINAANAFTYVRKIANKHAALSRESLQTISSSIYKDALIDLSYLAVERET